MARQQPHPHPGGRRHWLEPRGNTVRLLRLREARSGRQAPRAPTGVEELHDRRVLVTCLGDSADTLQHVRFAADLGRIARETMFRVPRPLMDLVREVPGIDHVFALTDDLHESDYDVDLDVSDLPRVLRIDARDFAAAVPYLGRSALLSRTLTRGRERRVRPCVGLAWRAGDWDVERNLPTHALQRLTSSGEARFQSLQFGASRLPPRTLDISCHDLRELARRMARLDLVIAVDSALAHLAGAMGLAVWTLLPANCDARWGQETEASPWYPTMKLFRQSSAGDWLGVIDRVIDELNKGAGLRFS